VRATEQNLRYLMTKRDRMGHDLPGLPDPVLPGAVLPGAVLPGLPLRGVGGLGGAG